MVTVKASVVLIVLFHLSFVDLFCVDLDALNNVTARVHTTRLSRGFKYNGNAYFLDKHEIISIYQGNITDLCEGMIKKFPSLKVLSLINVNLSRIQPGAFVEVPNLKELSLSVNNLTEIDNGCFNNLSSLEVFYLSGNNIRKISQKAFQNLPSLRQLHLDRNQLTALDPDVLSGSSKLVLLDLRYNLFTIIEKNNFPQLQPSISQPITFILAKNNIQDVDSSVFNFVNPVNLRLENNKLTTISSLFHGLKDYSSLNLDGNQLSCLPDDVLENIKVTTKNVSIKNNPLTCECMRSIENALGDRQEVFGTGILEYSSVFPCDFANISFE